jgi:hypothetical protein
MRYHLGMPRNSEEWNLPNRVLSIATVTIELLTATFALAQNGPPAVELQPGVSAKILDLKRVPGQQIVQLDYEISNNGDAPVNVAEIGIGRASYGLNEITLYDFPNKISFKIGVASECLCTQPPEAPLKPGETFKAWAWFAPPETNPGPFAVRFGSTLPVMDVPVQ